MCADRRASQGRPGASRLVFSPAVRRYKDARHEPTAEQQAPLAAVTSRGGREGPAAIASLWGAEIRRVRR